jgi:hypothetical protein
MSLKFRVLSAYYNEQQEQEQERAGGAARPTVSVLGPLLLVIIGLTWAAAFAFDFYFSCWVFVGLGFILAISGLRYPVAGLLGIGMLIAIEPVVRVYLPEVGFFRYNTVAYWLLLIILLYLPAILRMNDIHTRLLQVLMILVALEIIYSTRPAKGVQQVLEIITVFGIVIYFIRVLGKPHALYWLGVVVGTFSAIGGLVFNMQFAQLPYLNPNSWAFFPLTGIFTICLAFWESRQSGRRTIFLLVLFAVNYAWIFLSGSRGNMLSGLVCMLFILWQVRRMPWLVILMVAAAFFGYWITTQMEAQTAYAMERLQLFFDPASTLAHRTSGRSTLADASLKIFSNNPLGVGTGSFNDMFAEIDARGRNKPAHSAWLSVLAENGIPGILLLAGYVLSFAIVGWSRRREGLVELGLLITALIAAVFVSKEFYARGVWLMAAAGTVLMHQKEMRWALPETDPRRVLRRYSHLRNGWRVDSPPPPAELAITTKSSSAAEIPPVVKEQPPVRVADYRFKKSHYRNKPHA